MSARELWMVLERARQNGMQVTLSSVGGGKDNPIFPGIEVRTRKAVEMTWQQMLYVINLDTIDHAYVDVLAEVIEAQVEQILEATGGPDYSAGRVSWQSASHAFESAQPADHGGPERPRGGLRGVSQRADPDRRAVFLPNRDEPVQPSEPYRAWPIDHDWAICGLECKCPCARCGDHRESRARAVAKHLAAMEKADPEVYKRCESAGVFLGAMNQIIHMARTIPSHTMMYLNLGIMLRTDRELYEAMMDAKPPFAFHWSQICKLARDD